MQLKEKKKKKKKDDGEGAGVRRRSLTLIQFPTFFLAKQRLVSLLKTREKSRSACGHPPSNGR
jgi:hypothetical protein